MFSFNLHLFFLYVYSYKLCNLKQSGNKAKLLRFHSWFEKINVANLKGILSNSKNIKDLSSLTSLLIDRKKIISKCRMLKFKETYKESTFSVSWLLNY